MRVPLAFALAALAASAPGCSVQECTPGCASGFTVSIFESSGAPMPDGDWIATAVVGTQSGTARGTIKNGVLVSSEAFNEVDKGGKVQELFITVPGASPTVQVTVTHDGVSAGDKTYAAIAYTKTDDGCGGSCEVGKDQFALP
jgi:hypothetical protein